jgi:hypothetical protein
MNGNQSNESRTAKKDAVQPAKRAACQQAAFLSPAPRVPRQEVSSKNSQNLRASPAGGLAKAVAL